MNIKIIHDVNVYKGGIDFNNQIRKFTDKLKMQETNFSKYNSVTSGLYFEKCTKSQLNKIKFRLRNSKKLVGLKFKIIFEETTFYN